METLTDCSNGYNPSPISDVNFSGFKQQKKKGIFHFFFFFFFFSFLLFKYNGESQITLPNIISCRLIFKKCGANFKSIAFELATCWRLTLFSFATWVIFKTTWEKTRPLEMKQVNHTPTTTSETWNNIFKIYSLQPVNSQCGCARQRSTVDWRLRDYLSLSLAL